MNQYNEEHFSQAPQSYPSVPQKLLYLFGWFLFSTWPLYVFLISIKLYLHDWLSTCLFACLLNLIALPIEMGYFLWGFHYITRSPKLSIRELFRFIGYCNKRRSENLSQRVSCYDATGDFYYMAYITQSNHHQH